MQESTLGKPELVLSRAAEMAICELVAEPQVRKAVREPFLKRALVSTGVASVPMPSTRCSTRRVCTDSYTRQVGKHTC